VPLPKKKAAEDERMDMERLPSTVAAPDVGQPPTAVLTSGLWDTHPAANSQPDPRATGSRVPLGRELINNRCWRSARLSGIGWKADAG